MEEGGLVWWMTFSFTSCGWCVRCLPADSAAWPVFKCKHWSKHRGKGGGDKHQLRPRPQRQARLSLLVSMHSPQHGRRHCGSEHGEIKHRLCCWPHGYSIRILLASVQALDNKLDVLRTRISFQQNIRNCNGRILGSTIQPGEDIVFLSTDINLPGEWTGWWCSPASASPSCWCWISGRSAAATSSSSPLCSSSGLPDYLPAGPQRATAVLHLGGHTALHPQGHHQSHHGQRLPGVHCGSVLWSPCLDGQSCT